MRHFSITSRAFQASVVCLAFVSAAQAQDADFFREKVAPIFEARCLACHNGQDREGGLSLETRSAALKGGESGEVIVPENPDGSYLLNLITPSHGKADMPKQADPLSAQDVASIRKWIADGARWP
jgi:mono/diheme cytochrome c family protein